MSSRQVLPLEVLSLELLSLEVLSLSSLRVLLTGSRPPPSDLAWHPEYPLTETLGAVRLLVEAHRSLGWDGDSVPRWWTWQIVLGGCVVGDVGFHGPADAERSVELGFAVVPALRGRGIASAACRAAVARAWRAGARRVVAETEPDNVASQRVLAGAGFVRVDCRRLVIERP